MSRTNRDPPGLYAAAPGYRTKVCALGAAGVRGDAIAMRFAGAPEEGSLLA